MNRSGNQQIRIRTAMIAPRSLLAAIATTSLLTPDLILCASNDWPSAGETVYGMNR